MERSKRIYYLKERTEETAKVFNLTLPNYRDTEDVCRPGEWIRRRSLLEDGFELGDIWDNLDQRLDEWSEYVGQMR